MHLAANKQICNADKNTFAFIQALGEISWMVMQKFSELQFTFVSTQMESVYEQLKLLGNIKTFNHLLFAESGLSGAYGSRAVDITRKATSILAAPGNVPVSQVDKRLTTVTAPKIKPVARRKIRKKNS
jgi:hypothetical protein